MSLINGTSQPTSLPEKSLQQLLQPFGISAPDIAITDLALDSRDVAIHKAFLAIVGHQLDGRDFIPQAISLGAKAILAETLDETQHGMTEMREHSVIIQFYQLGAQVSAIAEVFFDAPAKYLQSVAVTGTNGKTSTAHFVAQLGNLLGGKVATIGTLGAGFIDNFSSTINTTPDAITMQRVLAELLAKGATGVAYEASSHALVQNRIKRLATDVAIFTNLTRDHLDYHGSMAEYGKAKRLLLRQPDLKYAVLNCNDADYVNWLAALPEQVSPVLFGIVDSANGGIETLLQQAQQHCSQAIMHYCFAEELAFSTPGIRFQINSSWGTATVTSSLLGEFNVANLLAAMSAQLCLGADLATLSQQISNLTAVPGRMELFKAASGTTFVVDYAHTPDALEQVLSSLKCHMSGQLWCVFGCGGERDQGKRPLMGRIAEQAADRIILTSDNSRSESTNSIIQDIQNGMITVDPNQVTAISSRKAAIQFALANAQPSDIVLLAGKGHETYQQLGAATIEYDERAYLTTLLNEDQP